MAHPVQQTELSLYLYTAQELRGFSNIATIDYWEFESLSKALPVESENKEGRESKALLSLVDWLAQFLVSGARGDVIAAAVVLKTDRPTLYISNNSCKASGTKIKELKSSIESLVSDLFHSYQEGSIDTDEKRRSASDKLLITTCTYSWARVLAKLAKTRTSSEDLPDNLVESFKRIYKLWESKVYKQSNPNEGLKDVDETDSKALSVLRSRLEELCNPGTTRAISIENRVEFLKTTIQKCAEIISSDIMVHMAKKENRASIGLCTEDTRFLGRLYRRLRRMIKFQSGVLNFLNNGMKTIADIWNMHENKGQKNKFSLKVVFVFGPDSKLFQRSVLSYRKTEVTSEMFYKTIETVKRDAIRDIPNKDPQILSQLNEKLKQITENGLKFEAKFHCETTLVLFLTMNGISVEHNAIGVSKLKCWSCTKFFDKLETLTNTKWLLTGSSGKSHHAWKYPTASLFKEEPGKKDFIAHFDTASQVVGELALTELENVIRSFFPRTPSDPLYGALKSIQNPGGKPPSTHSTPETKTKEVKPEAKLPSGQQSKIVTPVKMSYAGVAKKEIPPTGGALKEVSQKITKVEVKPPTQGPPAIGIKHRPQGSDSSIGSLSSVIMNELLVSSKTEERVDPKKGTLASKQ